MVECLFKEHEYMTHSILSDWHVATQLGLSGTELKAFLSAIEYIRQPKENDTEAVFRALTALHRQEHSVQVYVLEDTCRLMRQHDLAASPFVARFNRLVEAILSDLPAKLK